MKAMISQPMRGLSSKQIKDTRAKALAVLEARGYGVVDSYFSGANAPKKSARVVNDGLFYLAKSLEMMSECTAVYFCNGWDKARGCIIEYVAANAYGLKIIHEDKED